MKRINAATIRLPEERTVIISMKQNPVAMSFTVKPYDNGVKFYFSSPDLIKRYESGEVMIFCKIRGKA